MIQILMPTYNGEKYLAEQLDSLLAQDLEDWQLIISDDGSTDATVDIIEAYAAKHPGKITVHHSDERFGDACRHYLHLLSICTGDYIMFCDQDDVWDQDKISVTYKKMKEEERKGTPHLVFTDLLPVDRQLKEIASSMMLLQDQCPARLDYRDLIFRNIISGNTVMINRELKDLALKPAQRKGIIMHDWWLGIVAARFGDISYIDRTTLKYRQHETNQIGARKTKGIRYVLKRMNDLPDVRKVVLLRKKQAALFLHTYRDALTEKDRDFLTAFVSERSGALFYLRNSGHIRSLHRLLGLIVFG